MDRFLGLLGLGWVEGLVGLGVTGVMTSCHPQGKRFLAGKKGGGLQNRIRELFELKTGGAKNRFFFCFFCGGRGGRGWRYNYFLGPVKKAFPLKLPTMVGEQFSRLLNGLQF